MATDEALMLRYQDGDSEAFRQLYARYRAPLHRFLLRLAGGTAEAEDLYQEVWMAVVRGRERYLPSAKFATYLFSIAHRRASDRWRKRARRGDEITDPIENSGAEAEVEFASLSAEAFAENAELQQALLAAIAALPFAQSEAFLLKAEGLGLEAIAEATASSRETVKSRLRYAARRLRKTLEPWHG